MRFLESSDRLTNFADLPLAAEVRSGLEGMGVSTPTEVQQQAIPVALKGSDLIVVAQTGSGKTLAFALSILANFEARPGSRALILVPSREMAMQIHSVMAALTSLPTSLVIGGLPGNKQKKEMNRLPRLIIGTPGRLNDLLSHNKLLLQKVDMVVIDEADRMLDLGFAPQLELIQSTMRGARQTMLFSASFSPAVEAISKIFMPGDVVMVRSTHAETPVETLKQTVVHLPAGEKNARLVEELQGVRSGGILLFAGSQGSCERVAAHLNENGFNTEYIHGGLSQAHRSRIVKSFREGGIQILVATDLLARGLDIPLVETVINFDLPYSSEDFLHRIGRTARAGRSGRAITFVTPQDQDTYRKIRTYLTDAKEEHLGPAQPRPKRPLKKFRRSE